MFVVAMSIDGSSNYHQRLHALDVATGAELLGGPVEISASFPASGTATSSFDAKSYEERAALLLSNGTIYTSWTSHCDIAPYGGWIISYAESSLARNGVLNIAANSSAGPAIWMAGGGPAVDSSGQYLFALGQRRIRDDAGRERISKQSGLRQFIPQDLQRGCGLGRPGLFRHVE